MLVNKEGKIIANASQPTVIFNTLEEYTAWENSLPVSTTLPLEKILERFVIIKKYETVEAAGMVIFCDTEADMRGADGATKVHKKIDGALYAVRENNKLYRYSVGGTSDAPVDVWTLVGGMGGAKLVDALPDIADAEDGILYILKPSMTKYMKSGDELICVGTEVEVVEDFVIASHQTTEDGKTKADKEAGYIVIDSANGCSYVSLGEVAEGSDAWYLFARTNNSAEFYDTTTEFPNTDEDTFPVLSELPEHYAVEDRFFVARDTMKMYVIESREESGVTEYYYCEISEVIDNVDIHDYKDSSTAPASYTGDDFFPTVGSVDMLYVAKLEGIIYIWDGSAYDAVGGDTEVQVFAKRVDFPDLTTAPKGKLFVALDEAQVYTIDVQDVEAVPYTNFDVTGETFAQIESKCASGIIKEGTYISGAVDSKQCAFICQSGAPVLLSDAVGGVMDETTSMSPHTYAVTVARNCLLYNPQDISAPGVKLAPLPAETKKVYKIISERPTILYATRSAFPEVGTAGMIYIAKDSGKMYYYDSTSSADDKYIILGDSQDVIVDTKANILAKTLQKDILYVASDEKKCYVALPKEGVVPEQLELVQVGGGEIPAYTQAAWDALTEKPDMAFISDSIFDSDGFKS